MDRHYWSRHIARLDPETEYEQIYRILVSHEFPWDLNQSLSFALYRTYAVPSIGHLLSQTGELTQRTQKRYDDTVLILDTVLEHGLFARQLPNILSYPDGYQVDQLGTFPASP